MLQNTTSQSTAIVATLARIRKEWQEATGSSSLIDVEGSIGLLLADVINGIGLATEEQVQVLGRDPFQELQDFLKTCAHQ
jgi:hypothetical protein